MDSVVQLKTVNRRAPQTERPRWVQLVLWILFIIFAGLLLRELGKLFGAYRAR